MISLPTGFHLHGKMKNHRIPPHSLEMEEAVLGMILIDNYSLLETIEYLTIDCFYDWRHRKIFEKAILPMYNAKENIDILSVTEYLRMQNLIDKKLSPFFISMLTNKVSSSANIRFCSTILKQYAIKRNLILHCSKIVREAYKNETDSIKLLDKSIANLENIGIHLTSTDQIKIDKILWDRFKELEKQTQTKQNEIVGIPSGFYDLDKVTSGFQDSDLIIIAARPGMGKTSLVLNIAENAAINFGKEILIFSLEMAASQLINRSISSQSGIPLKKIRTGNLKPQELELILDKNSKLANSNLYIDDTPGLSILDVKTRVKKRKYEGKELEMVIVDYLQLINGLNPDVRNQNREQEISSIIRGLKELAKEVNIPIIALSQLSRGVENRLDKRPILSDLRESGAIEQDADIVMFIYRPDYYGLNKDDQGNDITGQAIINIAKHRNGALKEVKLGFYSWLCKFVPIDEFLKDQRV